MDYSASSAITLDHGATSGLCPLSRAFEKERVHRRFMQVHVQANQVVVYDYVTSPTLRGQGSEARFPRAPRLTLRGIVMQIYIRSCERAKDMTLYIRMRALVRMHDLTTCARACR